MYRVIPQCSLYRKKEPLECQNICTFVSYLPQFRVRRFKNPGSSPEARIVDTVNTCPPLTWLFPVPSSLSPLAHCLASFPHILYFILLRSLVDIYRRIRIFFLSVLEETIEYILLSSAYFIHLDIRHCLPACLII